MDAVILAGGKSERLGGIVPPYHKPFIVVNGKSLLVTAVDAALDTAARRIVVVATGENALPVWQLVGHRHNVRVVLSDRGVGDAVYRGLEVCTDERVLVLMSDNVHGENDVRAVVRGGDYAIGMRNMPKAEAERFTRYDSLTQRWYEGPYATTHTPQTRDVITWCGPLVIDRWYGMAALQGQQRLGPFLDEICPKARLVPVSTRDVGVPAAVAEVTA